MRILCHVHTFNDEAVIDQSLDAIRTQTHPVRDILVVDNASTDGTLARVPAGPSLVVVRHERNLGTSGAVATGLRYAQQHRYEWIWILDADSLPRPDALERLVALHALCGRAPDRPIAVLSSSHILVPSRRLFQGRRLTPGGPRPSRVRTGRSYCETDTTIWSGSLINISAVAAVGLPRYGTSGCWEDLGLDYGDIEFCFRLRRAGYGVLVHGQSFIDHTVGHAKQLRLFGGGLVSTNHSPERRYLYFRNLVYFWLYLYPRRNWLTFPVWLFYRFGVILLGIVALEDHAGQKIRACLRGARDGFRKSLDQPYRA